MVIAETTGNCSPNSGFMWGPVDGISNRSCYCAFHHFCLLDWERLCFKHRQDLAAFNTESLLPEVDNMACIHGHAPIKDCAETPAYILDPSDLVSGFTRFSNV